MKGEKPCFRTFFFVKAITLGCKSIAFTLSFDSFHTMKA